MSELPLQPFWEMGYSIAELWGNSRPVTRGTSEVKSAHLMLWGILSIVEYQVNHGAGHKYLRARLSRGEWVAIGYPEPKTEQSVLVKVPPIPDAQFGRKRSAVGDGITNYVDVRVVNAEIFTFAFSDVVPPDPSPRDLAD